MKLPPLHLQIDIFGVLAIVPNLADGHMDDFVERGIAAALDPSGFRSLEGIAVNLLAQGQIRRHQTQEHDAENSFSRHAQDFHGCSLR